ncbi:MAG: hypothetical protein JXA08_10120 [Methanomicrobiaceae archaeon]|nr:hypothetical protein [Methanomicrobiaceae archaeon]
MNRPPELDAIGNKNVNEGELLEFDVTATDPDMGDVLAYSALNLPAGATFTGQTFSWTPGFGTSGSYPGIVFEASDGDLADSEAIIITVGDVNRPPELDPVGNRNVNEGELLEFIVSAVDPDTGDILAYSAHNLPFGATFVGQTFSWTPGYDAAGVFENILFGVSDGDLSDSETIAITVADLDRNDPPVISPIADQSVDEGSLLSFELEASDPDGDALVYSAEALPAGADLAGPLFTWTPSYEQAGSYTITFTATDPGDLADAAATTITVRNVNRAPAFDPVFDRTVGEGSLLSFIVSASDPDGDSVLITAGALPAGATFDGDTFRWIPGTTQAGAYTVGFTATDAGGLADAVTITITVLDLAANHPPVFSPIGPQSIAVGQELRLTVEASDPDDDALIYDAAPLPAGATFSGQEFVWTPAPGQAGVVQITFTASDGLLTGEIAVTIAVTDAGIPTPEFPQAFIPAAMILGMIVLVLGIRRGKES